MTNMIISNKSNKKQLWHLRGNSKHSNAQWKYSSETHSINSACTVKHPKIRDSKRCSFIWLQSNSQELSCVQSCVEMTTLYLLGKDSHSFSFHSKGKMITQCKIMNGLLSMNESDYLDTKKGCGWKRDNKE